MVSPGPAYRYADQRLALERQPRCRWNESSLGVLFVATNLDEVVPVAHPGVDRDDTNAVFQHTATNESAFFSGLAPAVVVPAEVVVVLAVVATVEALVVLVVVLVVVVLVMLLLVVLLVLVLVVLLQVEAIGKRHLGGDNGHHGGHRPRHDPFVDTHVSILSARDLFVPFWSWLVPPPPSHGTTQL
jgi:hypothetical protein